MQILTKSKGGEAKMKRCIAFLVVALGSSAVSIAQEAESLHLAKTLPVPGVQRKWDHFGVDLPGNRLFVSSEEEPAIEVFELQTGKHLQTLTDYKETHNVLPLPELKKLLVVDGGASEIKVLDYTSYKVTGRIGLAIDADPMAYDPAKKLLYIVNGGRAAKTPYCLISIVDVAGEKKLADLKLDTNRLESMALEKTGHRLFVNMTGANEIGVVDRDKRSVVQTWPITGAKENVPMQYDEANHRLFVVTRKPSKLIVVNTDTGKEVSSLGVHDYVDDLAFDPGQHRLYAIAGGGEGAVSVIAQRDADTYEVIANVPTKPGAKTGKLVPELHRLYVGVPTKEGQEAQILIFEVPSK
jgi:DNA-binding beta-propeller fold protein YncE